MPSKRAGENVREGASPGTSAFRSRWIEYSYTAQGRVEVDSRYRNATEADVTRFVYTDGNLSRRIDENPPLNRTTDFTYDSDTDSVRTAWTGIPSLSVRL